MVRDKKVVSVRFRTPLQVLIGSCCYETLRRTILYRRGGHGASICDGVDINGQLKWKKEAGFNAMERPQYSMMVKNFVVFGK
jgi:hypothetical protein